MKSRAAQLFYVSYRHNEAFSQLQYCRILRYYDKMMGRDLSVLTSSWGWMEKRKDFELKLEAEKPWYMQRQGTGPTGHQAMLVFKK